MDMTNIRTIHTNLFSKKACEVIDSVMGQLSDGMWENSTAMEKYWLFARVEQIANGEVVIHVSKQSYTIYGNLFRKNGFYDMTDDEVKAWLGAKVKHIAQVEFKDNGLKNVWKRDNTKFEHKYFGNDTVLTTADVYFVYEWLMDRQISGRYSAEQINAMVGQKKNAAETAKIEAYRRKAADAQKAYAEELKKIDEWCKAEIAKIELEAAKRKNELSEKYRASQKAAA